MIVSSFVIDFHQISRVVQICGLFHIWCFWQKPMDIQF